MLVALPVGHALLAGKRRALTLPQLKDERFILVRQTGAPGLYADLLALCEQQGFTPTIGHEVGRMMSALSLVAAGEGVAVVPASMQGVHAQAVEYRPLAEARSLNAPLTLVFRESEYRGALKSLIDLVRKAAPAAGAA